MSTNNTKAMDEALQAAVARMNRSDNGGGGGSVDPIGLLAAVLPKFLENKGEREAVLEKLEGLHNEHTLPLRQELRLARQQIHRLRKAQDEMMALIQVLSEQQTAIGDAVLLIADQTSRLELAEQDSRRFDLESLNSREDDRQRVAARPARAAAAPRRAVAQSNKSRPRVVKPQA